ncbi:MAG: hypothetical protein J6K22_08660 [Spirochaetaceae bacterium]|nr:hypothetical protein [Spirochaetaceae bacterium]MBQ3024545.1 hypothetical protein [Spirochaetaceae bacterium]
MKKFSLFLLFLVTICFMACNNSEKEIAKLSFITEEFAKEVVAKDIMESDYYQQFYVLSSPKFDERVYDITWGETVFISVLPDGKLHKEKKFYYLITGVMPDGQVLGIQTVNAITGELENGALLLNSNSNKMYMATQKQCSEYASSLGYITNDLEAIFYYDGSIESFDPIYSWKYCINTKNSRSVLDADNFDNYVFIDPWINATFSDDLTLRSDNVTLSRVGFNHRAFVLNKEVNSRNTNSNATTFIPID